MIEIRFSLFALLDCAGISILRFDNLFGHVKLLAVLLKLRNVDASAKAALPARRYIASFHLAGKLFLAAAWRGLFVSVKEGGRMARQPNSVSKR